MRQYCSGGSRIWSSIQPLPGVCSSGWLRKKTNRPPGSSTRATSASGVVDGLDVLEHQAGDHRVEGPVGERQRGGRRPRRRPAPPPRRPASATWAQVGSTPTTRRRRRRPARRATCPSPQPTSSTRRAPARCAAASGRICSSYSGSAPSVNPSCHQPACASQTRCSSAPCPSRSRRAPAPPGCRRGSCRRPPRPPSSGSHDSACRSSSDACFTAGHAAELLDQPLLAGRPEARDVVEHRLGHALVAQLAVVA